jgi:hypothetical protein
LKLSGNLASVIYFEISWMAYVTAASIHLKCQYYCRYFDWVAYHTVLALNCFSSFVRLLNTPYHYQAVSAIAATDNQNVLSGITWCDAPGGVDVALGMMDTFMSVKKPILF